MSVLKTGNVSTLEIISSIRKMLPQLKNPCRRNYA